MGGGDFPPKDTVHSETDMLAKKFARQLDFTQDTPLEKPESPKSKSRTSGELRDGTAPQNQRQCNCKHSRCLKLYCECFSYGTYCNGCNCVNCCNNVENEPDRREAVESALERNPNAFRLASNPHGVRHSQEEVLAKQYNGCHCKKSECLRKYCECFHKNILCSENCKCMDCKNFEGSEDRKPLFHGDPSMSHASGYCN